MAKQWKTQGFTSFGKMEKLVKKVVLIRDVPRISETKVPECVDKAWPEISDVEEACSIPVEKGLHSREPITEVAEFNSHPLAMYGSTPGFYEEGTWYPVAGGLILFFEQQRMSAHFVRSYEESFTAFPDGEWLVP